MDAICGKSRSVIALGKKFMYEQMKMDIEEAYRYVRKLFMITFKKNILTFSSYPMKLLNQGTGSFTSVVVLNPFIGLYSLKYYTVSSASFLHLSGCFSSVYLSLGFSLYLLYNFCESIFLNVVIATGFITIISVLLLLLLLLLFD